MAVVELIGLSITLLAIAIFGSPMGTRAMTFNISNSTIASLNLGTVGGDRTASVQTLDGYGHKELADIVRTISEAIAASNEMQGH